MASDNWSISRMLQQIEVGKKASYAKYERMKRGWAFGLQERGNLPRVNPKREKSRIEPA